MKKYVLLFILMMNSTFVQCNLDVSSLPTPYCNVQQLLPLNDGPDWYMNAQWMSNFFNHNTIEHVVEVGSWLGRSTRHIASMLPAGGKLYAVDTWMGSVEHHNVPSYAVYLPTLYDQFLSNIIHSGMTSKIIPIKMRSLDAVSVLKSYQQYFDLIYIDAEHDTGSVWLDLKAYLPLIKPKTGILCGDDWLHTSVKDAVIQFAQFYKLTIYADYNFWFLVDQGYFACRSFLNASSNVWKFTK